VDAGPALRLLAALAVLGATLGASCLLGLDRVALERVLLGEAAFGLLEPCGT
jgi:hypothetical protein